MQNETSLILDFFKKIMQYMYIENLILNNGDIYIKDLK